MMKTGLGVGILSGTVLALWVSSAGAQSASASPDKEADTGLISLLDVAPEAYYSFKRMHKYYSDPNMDPATVDGGLLDRPYILGSLSGWRSRMAEKGFIFDGGVTQVFQQKSSGNGDSSASAGSLDLWATVDTGRAGWWSGGMIVSHLESNWGDILEATGTFLPLNTDATMPSTPDSTALSELYLVQALPNDFTLIAGKFDWSGTADPTLFANNERTQFLHNALINNTVLGAFVPYTSIGAAVSKQLTPELSGTLITFSNDSDAQSFNFDTFDLDTMTYAYTMAWTPTFGNRPGNYNFIIGGSNKDVTDFDVSADYLIGELVGLAPVAEKSTNRAFTIAASQYLWVDDGARRWDGRPAGFGPFFRIGGAPKDRNVIDAFYSVGLGGTIGAFGRSNDSWGIGWLARISRRISGATLACSARMSSRWSTLMKLTTALD